MNIPILLVEDEPVLARRLEQQLRACWPDIDVLPHADNGAAAIALALEHLPRVIFLDIHMPACSGLEAAAAIIEDWPDGYDLPELVFVTAYNQYALQAFDHGAVDYLLKPVSAERLEKTVTRLRQRLEGGALRTQPGPGLDGLCDEIGRLSAAMQPGAPPAAPLTLINAAIGPVTHLIPIHEVLYFEAAEKSLRVITRQREALIRMTLRELLTRVDPQAFWQVHRSVVVQASQLSHVERTEDGKLLLSLHGHPTRLTVSRLFAHRFKAM